MNNFGTKGGRQRTDDGGRMPDDGELIAEDGFFYQIGEEL
jgi:hypothetical protein